MALVRKSQILAASFEAEAEMLPLLHDVAKALWVKRQPEQTWVLLDEQRLHSRIADLAVIRLDIAAIKARAKGGWLRPLALRELRALHALRPDRSASIRLVAAQMRVSEAGAAGVLRGLASAGFVTKESSGAYRRVAPVSALAERIITIEAKRDDPGGALRQARAHRAWNDETYVAFDAAYSSRFRRRDKEWKQLGIGLIELQKDQWKVAFRAQAHRRSNRLEAALVGERALDSLLGSSPENRPERRLPHGHRLVAASEPIVLGPKAKWIRSLKKEAPLA